MIFSIAQAILSPFIFKMASRYASAFLGGIGLVSDPGCVGSSPRLSPTACRSAASGRGWLPIGGLVGDGVGDAASTVLIVRKKASPS